MISLDNAVVWDCECLPNVFTLTAETLYGDQISTWEISQFRDDRLQLIQWLNWLAQTQTPMIGFNSINYDYPMIHAFYRNPHFGFAELYAKSQSIINSADRFGHVIWDRDRLAPQIDLYRIHHFDNIAKTTSLKALEINMRAPNVRESKLPFDQPVSQTDIDGELIPYNITDVRETKRFAFYSMKAIEFRLGLIDQFGIEALNFNDTKIGERMLEQRLGDEVCFDHSSGRKQRRQTPRSRIALAEIIFPYIRFDNPEFQRVHQFMLAQVLTPDDITDPDSPIKTKGVFTNLIANVGGLEFYFGTGGVHASVASRKFVSDDDWKIIDIDVEGLYPNIAIVNRLAPEHLGDAFIGEYSKIPIERKTHAKGTYQNAALKLAANGAWGKSNSKFSVFYDPKYAMTVPVNGQLLLCMLAERLANVPTLEMIAANTDGITYRIRREFIPVAKQIETDWQAFTCLKLEYAEYQRLFIKDVNNYLAEDIKGKLKQKGCMWFPDPFNYADSISQASPPCWYKDLSNIVSTRAAVAAMVHGIDPEHYIRFHTDPFDFMCRAKCDRSSQLELGGNVIQRTTRYYVAREGAPLVKISPPPPGHTIGQFKRKGGVTLAEYNRVMTVSGGTWNAAVCTGKADKPDTWGRYDDRRMAIQAGWMVAECNQAADFRFDNVNYEWYLQESRKLIIT